MKKDKSNIFPSLLEKVIVDIWGGSGNRLSAHQIRSTRAAASFVRRVYRHKGEHGTIQPSRINYQLKKNRAGYLAAFGERRAYLSYLHLKKVQGENPDLIPNPHGKRNELVITSLGAGACIELFGICLFYLSDRPTQSLLIRMNSIEKEREWNSSQHLVFTRVLKDTFPKVDVDKIDIAVDLKENAITAFANHYDRLINTDILLIYNVLNEIPSTYATRVWRNIRFLVDIFQKNVLILLMEPSAPNAEPRIYIIKEQLAQQTNMIEESKEEKFQFDEEPICIKMIDSEDDLNYRLFGPSTDRSKPQFDNTISRAHFSSVKIPDSPITVEQIAKQLSKLGIKRIRKGSGAFRHARIGQQYTFVAVSDEWKLSSK
jgi:hypothetical protein